jgi:single-strand DNA-binding protein
MSGVNKVILIGRLGADPSVNMMPNGNKAANISVATSEKWKDAQGNPVERTEWHRVSFFNRLAEIVEQYLKKGAMVYIEGSIRYKKYTDKNGIEKNSVEIMANNLQMLGGGAREEAKPVGLEQAQAVVDQFFNDDCPF